MARRHSARIDPWMARALAGRRRAVARKWSDIVGNRQSLFPEFSGELLFTPEFIPVCLDFRRMIRNVKAEPRELLTLDSRQFEELVAELWRRLGYEIELTAKTKDNGRDIIAVRKVEASVRFLIECKRYSPSNKVGGVGSRIIWRQNARKSHQSYPRNH
jgi:restriction endonuclease